MGIILSLLGSAVGIASRALTAPATGAVGAISSLAAGLGVRFYAGLAAGLVITDNKVRHDAIALAKAILGAIV